jgi:hypothetical protein
MEGKNKLLLPKWDFFYKHVGHRIFFKNIGINVKKGDWYYSKDSMHSKNYKLFVSRNHESIASQVAKGVVGEKGRKVVQFATMLHLLQQGHPMLEYEALKHLFQFLQMLENNNKHWNDNFN